ncbi:MAG: hypothetical protein QOH70_434 [Blastocatellia bacterium]|nr:hypothetical protein [Blastocatellia bacterium]
MTVRYGIVSTLLGRRQRIGASPSAYLTLVRSLNLTSDRIFFNVPGDDGTVLALKPEDCCDLF